jgi:hypothetical protein
MATLMATLRQTSGTDPSVGRSPVSDSPISGTSTPIGRIINSEAHCVVTAKDAGATTLDVQIESSHTGAAGSWVAVGVFAQFNATGINRVALPDSIGPYVRYYAVLAGARVTDRWTFSVSLSGNPVPN